MPRVPNIIELKRNEAARVALDQINRNGYADPYKGDKHPVVKLGLNFSEEERIITDYAVEM